MIFKNSRYENEYQFFDDEREGAEFIDPVRLPLFEPDVREDFIITFESWMRLDLLAHTYYGEPELLWAILDANPNYASALDINVGDVLIIPNPDKVVNRYG